MIPVAYLLAILLWPSILAGFVLCIMQLSGGFDPGWGTVMATAFWWLPIDIANTQVFNLRLAIHQRRNFKRAMAEEVAR